jgi:hypothetical protein
VGFHGGQFVCRDLLFGGHLVVVGETPSLGTAAFARSAADAQRAVVQDGLWHIETFKSFLTEIAAKV